MVDFRLRGVAWLVLTLLALGVANAAKAESPWSQDLYNPQPADGDFVLPMPCSGAMVFRAVVVPGKDLLDDRRIVIGGIDKDYAFKENQRADFIAGGFSDPKEPGKRLYYIGKYEVTRLQFASLRDKCPTPDDDARLPQTNVTWYEAAGFGDTYTNWLLANVRDKMPKEVGQAGFIRLPTETEWEFAARGGAKVSEADFAAPLFPMSEPLASYVQYGGPDSSNNELQWIGLLKPNPLGIHDILGNAAELVFDLFRLNRLSRPHGEAGGFVVRGGDYLTSKDAIRTAARDEFPPYDEHGSRRQNAVGFRVVLVSSVLPTPKRVREAQVLWDKLPETAGGGLAEPVQDDPLREVETLARAAQDPQVKERLQGLGTVIAANIKTRNDQRDRAARASLHLATWLADTLRVDVRKILGLEEAVALGSQVIKQRLPNDIASLRGSIGYYRDTLRHILDEFPQTVRSEQARLLRQELEERKATAQAAMVVVVERDSARYQKEGDLPAEKVETELRREYCRKEGNQLFRKACVPYLD